MPYLDLQMQKNKYCAEYPLASLVTVEGGFEKIIAYSFEKEGSCSEFEITTVAMSSNHSGTPCQNVLKTSMQTQ